ncbi:hypothetical protein C1N75_12615 [Curtobacterium sp. SGAir0571]|uniref:hypothetical protein n=1 Tax=Curtobacterium sp. SGAir0471 TaxID=2070337 RepID=UPI0010F57C4B|nr:hypothetical protein [Curtobacterium sp. SGAir0471]
MSGSEGPDLDFGGGGREDDCGSVSTLKALEQPDPHLDDQLRNGTILTLQLVEGDFPTIVAVLAEGQVAGAVMPDQRLINCLRAGFRYFAEVSRTSGAITLRVSAA